MVEGHQSWSVFNFATKGIKKCRTLKENGKLRYICSMVSEKRALCHSYEYCY